MPASTTTYSLVGDLFVSTSAKKYSYKSFAPVVSGTEKTEVAMTIPTGTTDLVINFGGIDEAIAYYCWIDPELEGSIKLNFNGSDTAELVKQFKCCVGTSITSATVTNDSGNTAAFVLLLVGA